MTTEEILAWLAEKPEGVTIRELSALVGWCIRSPTRLKNMRKRGLVVGVGRHAYVRICLPEHAATALACSERIREAKTAAAREWKRLYDVEKGKRRRALLNGHVLATNDAALVRSEDDDESEIWPVVHRWLPAEHAARISKPCAASVWELAS